MKLRTKLKISFVIVIFLPIALSIFIIATLLKLQNDNVKRVYDVEDGTVIGSMYTPVSILIKMTDGIYEEILNNAQADPDLFKNEAYLQELAARTGDKLSSLIVRKNGEIIYSNSEFSKKELQEILPAFGDKQNNPEEGIYYGGSYQSLVKQVDFEDADRNFYSLFIITSIKQVIPQIKLFLVEGVIAIITVVIITSSILIMWIYRSVLIPLARLKLATQNIKEGNLDFVMPFDVKNEISELCRDFEEMRLILKKSTEEKMRFDAEEKELITNISHDLKTPLTAIKGYVEGLIDGVADTEEKRNKYLMTISNKVNDMDKLINELTIYSKIDTNRIPYTFKKISMKEYFKDCSYEIGLDLESRDIDFQYRYHANSDMFVMADAEQMKRAINNIISNSVKYTAQRKTLIKMDIYDRKEYAHIKIEDNGRGISKEEIPLIFTRFYRTDASRNSMTGGSGIGLAIVKKIINDHNGNIWAESKEGIGTSIHIELKKHV